MNNIIHGDSLTALDGIDSNSIDCCVTSPPYYGLRDYHVDGQIGLEPTFDLYIQHLTDIFLEVKRVLKKEGSCWVVIGDSYAGNNSFGNDNARAGFGSTGRKMVKRIAKEIPEKSVVMIPERFAIAMLDQGWILRNKIIWYKPNCMPSSAKDRFTVDYEYIYFFVKSKKYYFKTQYEPIKREWDESNGGKFAGTKTGKILIREDRGEDPYPLPNPLGRIKRTVWKIPPKPFPDAHFAVFPEELVNQCLDAGCPPNGITLDPFMGSGTVALQALKTNRQFIGIELNKEYVDMANKRIEPYLKQTKLLPNTITS